MYHYSIDMKPRYMILLTRTEMQWLFRRWNWTEAMFFISRDSTQWCDTTFIPTHSL